MRDHPGEALSAYLDDELEPAARAAVETHLRECDACRAIVHDLRRLRDQAAAWPAEAAPSRDLWTGIAARLEPRPAATTARLLPWHQRRWSVGIAELAAAAALVAAVTAGLVWRGAPGVAPAPDAPTPVLAQIEPVGAPEGAITSVSFADAQFDAAVADLERVLRDQRDQLNPRTVQVLERNLQIIDEAIREARAALENDPANALLNAHLAGARQRKLNLLRQAALISEGV
jgi:hypothetical protein